MITSKGIEFKADGSQQRQCVYDVKHSSSLRKAARSGYAITKTLLW